MALKTLFLLSQFSGHKNSQLSPEFNKYMCQNDHKLPQPTPLEGVKTCWSQMT